MPIASNVARHLDSGVRDRGRQYFRDGRVDIKQGSETEVFAHVSGSETYGVRLSIRGKSLKVACDCPYWEDHGTCKHIWATILEADRKGYLRGKNGIGPLNLIAADEPATSSDDPDVIRGTFDWDPVDAEDEDFEEDEGYYGRGRTEWRSRPVPPTPTPVSASPVGNDWLSELRAIEQGIPRPRVSPWQDGRQILYLIDLPQSELSRDLIIQVGHRTRSKEGRWNKPQAHGIETHDVPTLPDAADRQILSLLKGATEHSSSRYYSSYSSFGSTSTTRYQLPLESRDLLLALMCKTGRCALRPEKNDVELTTLHWDEGPAWQFRMVVEPSKTGTRYQATGELCRGEEHRFLFEARAIFRGIVLWQNTLARLDTGTSAWITLLRSRGIITVPKKHAGRFLKDVLEHSAPPLLHVPPELAYEEVTEAPKLRLKLKKDTSHPYRRHERLVGELHFEYRSSVIAADSKCAAQFLDGKLIRRDASAEAAAAAKLREVGFQPEHLRSGGQGFYLTPRRLPAVVRTLTAEGWHVEAEGKLFRNPGVLQVNVRSGIDWFELHGTVSYGETEVKLPALLAAVRRGEDTVRLDDGTFGIVPEEWLKKYAALAGMGTAEDGHVRFTRAQVGLLDALLAAQPEVACDEAFTRLRDELHSFGGVKSADAPEGFTGELRGYQCDGLGWFSFLERFQFGGCLADDMGLGKTVQVLALLEQRRQARARARGKNRPGPSLVVVPRSLVFNWQQEAARFAPRLRVLDHTGTARPRDAAAFADVDVILTTYGTLRRDILLLKDVAFDYCILDEAQAIKNASSDSAKAVRLLQGRHRLALSGTPVENHLGELWSLFEFLNPGMLGSASALKLGGGLRNPDAESRQLLARALRPFLLRRTKEQVASDLPSKTEQTLYCDLDAEQRQKYDELREHYRRSLLERGDETNKGKYKIQVLEALLRLRQAACHPGLITQSLANESSAKLDILLPQLQEVTEEGHKALVFSQFTTLLGILRKRLDAEGIPYEYLDGRTRDRQARVKRFQTDPACKLFLVSLKAGGLGLNLTAAEYVFLLDPWWNPAVEAQAIDRTHRIGQSKPVFAYRLIARNTVEEKVLELQQKKRALADAILREDNALIRDLTREDLELLLS